MTNEQNVVRSVFSSYINDLKAYSTKPNRPMFKMLEDVRDKAIKALETTCIEDYPTCTECEHYDSEKHYCPRFCQVIKDTLAEAQPCEDCISRDSLNDAISELTYWHFEDGRLVVGGGGIKSETVYKVDDVARMPNILPSVTPQRPKGKWLRRRPSGCYSEYIMECSECKGLQRSKYNFCPSCGCRMEVEE